MDLLRIVVELGGIVRVGEVIALGATSRQIARLVGAEELFRVRQGIVAHPGVDASRVAAARLGGVVACAAAGVLHGLWSPPSLALHVAVERGSTRLRRHGEVVHWRLGTGRPGAVQPLPEAIRDLARCLPPEHAFAMIESGLHRGILCDDDWAAILAELPARHRRLLDRAARNSESGTESIFRFRTFGLGARIRQQVEIPGVGRVDFVIGDRLVVEIDSRSHHSGEAARRRDLRRDAALLALGYLPLRIDYWQVMDEWASVEALLRSLVARGEHLAAA